MDIRELIDTLENVALTSTEVLVNSTNGPAKVIGVLLTREGVILVDAEPTAGEHGTAEPQPDPRIGMTVNDWRDLNLLPVGTEIRDEDGDLWLQFEEGRWTWYKYSDGSVRLEPENYYANSSMLGDALPGTLTKIVGN